MEQWRKRDITGKEYVHVWANGIHVKSRLDGEKTCLLVTIGVEVDGKVETFKEKYEKAVENLKKDKEDLFRFYDYPAEHWIHIRTGNPIESTFANRQKKLEITKRI